MRTWQPILAGLLATTLFTGTIPQVFADSMWVPRLGYPVQGPKRVYLDITTEREVKAKSKEARAQDKEQKRQQKDEKRQADKETRRQEKLAKQEAKETLKETSANLSKAEQETLARKRVQDNRYLRQKALMEERIAKREKARVDGDFYLYSLKQDRLLYKESAKLNENNPQEGLGAFHVDFATIPAEGLYEIAVRGSGHRSEQALWVSDAIYWDALLPVMQDFTKAHCPLEKGKSRILHECFNTNASVSELQPGGSGKQLVQGGWYLTEATDSGEVKNTVAIANTAQLLMNLYSLNPASYKYVALNGDGYAETRYPDLLDEAAWGLQYLVTIQQPDGSFPSGIQQSGQADYILEPVSNEASVRSVAALARAAEVFKTEDLSQSVKFVRAAEKGFRRLQGQELGAEDNLLMLHALSQATDDPQYDTLYQAARQATPAISAQTALLMGDASKAFTVRINNGGISNQVLSWEPLMVSVGRNLDPQAIAELSQRVTDLFGYEKVYLKRDMDLAVASPLKDPLQWMATKTGEVATRFGQSLQDNRILSFEDTSTVTDNLKEIEDKENAARRRISKGYDQLTLNPQEKLYLAYALALLNQAISVGYNPVDEEKKKEDAKRQPQPLYDAPPGSIKGYYPKEI